MKNAIQILCLLVLTLTGLSAYSQKYKKVEDTARLNKEYIKVSNDIIELSSKLTIAQNNLPGYKSKANEAGSDALDAANKSTSQAAEAAYGNVKDARKAKRKAKKALREARDSRSASNSVNSQENKITKLTLQLTKKQQRLQELDVMRLAIQEKFMLQPAQ